MFDAAPLFSFDGPDGHVVAHQGQPVPPGTAADLAARIAPFLTAPDALIGGALPFDKTQADRLWQAQPGASADPAPAMPPLRLDLTPEPTPAAYAHAVEDVLAVMAREQGAPGGLRKAVLARSLLARADRPIPAASLLARLGVDPAVTAYGVRLDPGRWLVGATPELLLAKTGARIASHPLAGSAPRSGGDNAAALLARSDKDRREHEIVVEYILDTLAPFCDALSCPQGTTISATASMWHLGTRIEGRLRDASIPAVLLAQHLHPTPAVCGLPVARAADLIARLEPVPRGFFAGAVGWCNGRGDGVWHVAIRCAEISGATARLYAGAGIVPGSDPRSETAETGAKFGALLAALGLPTDAGIPRD